MTDQRHVSHISMYHGSLEGVGGLKTNESYHLKADTLPIPKMYFFENLPTPFFGNVCFIKFGPFSALLALPVMIREEYGQMAHQTLPNILLSDASLVTKSYIARFVDDDAFNPSALSNCSTGPSPPAGARAKCVVIDKPSDARLRNHASVTEQDVRKRLMCHLPVFLPYHNR